MAAESMDDILNPPTETEETTTEQEESTEQTSGITEVEEEETGAAEPQTAAETQTEEPADVKGIKAAMLAERRKRQETEAKLARLEAEREAAAKEEKPFLGEEYEQRFADTKAEMKEELVQTKIAMSQELASEKWADYAEKEAAFIEMAKGDPALVQRMRDSANPAAFAYKHVTETQKLTKLQELGDPDEYAAKLRETIKAELKAELEAEKTAAVEAAIKAKLKGGFSEHRSVGSERTTTKKFNGPTPMSDILG